MRRREFLGVFGGALLSPTAVWAQQRQPLRRIGVFMPGIADNSEYQLRNAAFLQRLAELGWVVGRNIRIDYRWGAGETERYQQLGMELAASRPDVVLAVGSACAVALKKSSATIPIIFANVTDPVGTGLVSSLSQPGGNATGFVSSEMGFGSKWLELLREIAPSVRRVAVTRDASIPSQVGLLAGIQSFASSSGIELTPLDLNDRLSIEAGLTRFANQPNGGLIVTIGARTLLNRDLLVSLAERHRLPAVYGTRSHVDAGGLASYGSDQIEQYRRGAEYVDRILKGDRAAELPVQTASKFELVINLKTAKVLGLIIPPILLARADEVIE